MLFAFAAALLLGWLVWTLFENGPGTAAIIITVLVVWALIDYGR